jgi:HAE1 family hydrophobic/amphiphilic exporter-1
MLENIVRHKEQGLSTYEAAIVGSREIGFTILSMTVSLVAVFIPIIFMQGMIGRLLHEFALTITAAILVSGVVSITLTPMMCSRFVKSHEAGSSKNPILRWSEAFFDGMLKGYEATLRWCLARKPLILAMFAGTVVSTGYLFTLVQKDFLPEEDSGRLLALVEAGQDASYEQLLRANRIVAQIAAADPNIYGERVMMRAGASGPSTTSNAGLIFMPTKPAHARPEPDVRKIVQGLRQKLNQIPNVKVFVTNPPIIRVGGRLSNAQYQYTLQDVDLESLQLWSNRMTTEIAKVPGFQDVVSDLKISSPSINVRIDRDKASSLGVSPELIESALGSAFGNRKVSTIYTSASQYSVILEVDPKLQADPETIRRLFVRAPATGVIANIPGTTLSGTTSALSTNVPARLIPLDSLVKLDHGVASLTVSHQGQLPAVTISFNLTPDVSLGTAIDRIRALERQLQMPATMSTNFAGTAQVFESSLKGMGLLLLMAILVVYIILGILYESFIHPLTILSGLPAASMGALLTLIWFDKQLTLYAFVGIIMLVGIVKKNAIMMIDFALSAQRERKIHPEQAIFEACIVRFRPIMMTTFAALVGAIPIAMGHGQGGEARAPLGLTVVGGLVLSQIITLYLTPVIYIYFDRMQALLQKRPARTSESVPASAMPHVRQAAE